MKRFAAMIDLQGKHVTVIGGGKVAERKITSLLDTGAIITVVSPRLTNGLHHLVKNNFIHWKRKRYEKTDTTDAFLIIAATNITKVNEQVREHSYSYQLVIDASTPQSGNVIMPAVFQKGSLQVAISTNGASPSIAKKIRDALKDIIDDDIILQLDDIAKTRKNIITTNDDPSEKAQRLQELTKQFKI